MRILLLTENPVLALGLEAALLKAGHFASFSRPIYSSLLRCSTIAELREQLTASIESVDPPNVLVLDHAHVGMAVLKELNEEMKRVQTVLWADEIAVEFAYQSLTVGVRGVLRKSWSAEVLVASLEQVAAGELCYEKVLSDQFLMSRRKAVTNQGRQAPGFRLVRADSLR